MVLRRGVPRDGAPDLVGFFGRQSAAETGNNVELAKSLTGKKSRRDRGIRAAVTMAARGDGRRELRTQHVVSILLISREDAVLVEKADISKTVYGFGRIVLDVGGVVHVNFAVEAGDQVQPTTGPIVPGGSERGRNLASKVRAKHLNQHRIG